MSGFASESGFIILIKDSKLYFGDTQNCHLFVTEGTTLHYTNMKELDFLPQTLSKRHQHEVTGGEEEGGDNGQQESKADNVCYLQVPEEDNCEANPTFEEKNLLRCQQWSIPEQDFFI